MDVLEGYTTEEIQEIARKHIESRRTERKDLILKINKIDKEYRKHNEHAVIRGITNGTLIIALSAVLMRNDMNISEIANDKIIQMINESYERINQITDNIPMGEITSVVYAKVMGIAEVAIEKIGIVGIILASKAVSFVTDTVSDGIKTVKMKKEMNSIRDKIEETYEFEPNNRSK